MFDGAKQNLHEGVGVIFCANVALIFEEFSSKTNSTQHFNWVKVLTDCHVRENMLESEKHIPPRGWRKFGCCTAPATHPSWHLYLTFIFSFFYFENLKVNLLDYFQLVDVPITLIPIQKSVSNYYTTYHFKLYRTDNRLSMNVCMFVGYWWKHGIHRLPNKFFVCFFKIKLSLITRSSLHSSIHSLISFHLR